VADFSFLWSFWFAVRLLNASFLSFAPLSYAPRGRGYGFADKIARFAPQFIDLISFSPFDLALKRANAREFHIPPYRVASSLVQHALDPASVAATPSGMGNSHADADLRPHPFRLSFGCGGSGLKLNPPIAI